MELSWQELENNPHKTREDNSGFLVTRNVNDLRPHPSWLRHNLTISSSDLSSWVESEYPQLAPISITRTAVIIDGYAQWELARRRNQRTVCCIEYDLNEDDALRFLLDRHRRFSLLNNYLRIILALDLEPKLKTAATQNKSVGGTYKDPSKLTEVGKVEVRVEIAKIAKVAVGNVTKVKQVIQKSDPKILDALQSGEIRIHRAWQWKDLPAAQQRENLTAWRLSGNINRKIRFLISRHANKEPLVIEEPLVLLRRLAMYNAPPESAIRASVMDAPGKIIFISKEMLDALPPYQESFLRC
jgi:hypothetical protein